MPCYDAQSQKEIETIYESGVSPYRLEVAEDTINKLTAMLCATFNELDRLGIAEQVAAEASRNGLINIMGFYNDHSKNDKTRLAKELHKYSKDEQRTLKKLLKKADL